MTREEFLRLAAAGYNRIPLACETLADFDTPLSIYLKLADQPNSYLLESVQGGEKWGRYSMIGLPSRTVMRVHGYHVSILQDGVEVERHDVDDPLAFVESFKDRYKVADIPGLPRFNGGLVGYFGYDCVRYVEKRLGASPNPDPLGVPDILLMVSDAVVVFDNLAGKMHAIVLVDPAEEQAFEQGKARLAGLLETLRQPITPRRGLDLSGPLAAEPEFRSSYTREDYENAVGRIKEYILAGDCMQVVPSQRMSIDFKSAPIDLYRALRCFNPTPYMYFFNFGDFHVVGSSPEVLVRVEDNLVTVRPIAGTRPRGATEEADRALEDDLLSDEKEIAEHLMLIDLGRNDVGRVSSTGSVRLTEKMVIERYSNVMHIVSNVTGQLREGLTAMDALRAILPAGTLSGAPKIRAMEIIDELEPVKRGVYGGAVGYFAWNGNMDTAIAIRTAVIKDGELHVQAGGGIVADSVPALEWEETINKRRAMFRAVALAEQTSAK
ncbi:anthranilate synthase component I [Pseudomonas kermanshahensis]|jgi:anthranilate synthase component 1|uniref:Anthranilate synthase component 1 n=1 Tax=Pseudomonas kermanshahensis TaxID=2745482 RepID=A0ABU8RBN0_9PSED|nr:MULTISPECIES: anthranilate synthase component I [Pseudomonas]GLO58859.1 anthranilate synthase component I [Pseudomonas putida]MBC3487392.1 anthranilate synthase component I [Pseudomonas sp. SWRI50]MBC3499058.1 anthranilate synthase component I [Pseudomonas sp. SWRI67]MBV4524546.1 anthranilate synthase component I [Pseudomonas kermanshahensis]MCX2685602.1 anthranilate synthase component I [Pseudomonas sp. DCB_AW]